MDNIEKGTELAKQVDAAVEQARKEGTTGRFFKKFMTMNQNNQPTIIVVPIVMENTYTSSVPSTSSVTSTNTGTVSLTPIPNNYRNADRNAADSEDDEDEEQMIIEEHDIESDDDEDVEEGKATKKKNNKRANQMRRKNKNKNMKKAFNKGVNVDIPAQYRKYFNNQKQVHIPASMLQKAKAQSQRAGNKNGGKRRIVRRKPNRKN